MPLAVGVPVMLPEDPPSVRPAGSEPCVMDHVYGDVPPVAPSVTVVYDTLTVPFGSVGAVVMVGPGVIVNEKSWLAEPPPLSVTFAVKLNGPEAVGVPLTAPLEPSVIPCGSAPPTTDHV